MRDEEGRTSELDHAFDVIAREIRDSAAEPPAALLTSVMDKIQQNRRRRQQIGRGIAMAACLVLIVAAGLGLRYGLFSGFRTGTSASAPYDNSAAAASSASGGGAQGIEPASAPMLPAADQHTGTDIQTAPVTESDGVAMQSPAPSPASSESAIFGAGGTALYENTGPGLYEPLLKNLDDTGVALLIEYLNLQQIDAVHLPMLPPDPAYVLEVKRPDGSLAQRNFWVSEGALYCDSPDDMYIYKAACSPAEFLAYVRGIG
ncbi:MAG: hypothetical protein FWC62_04370 [Firmicutes bacterium]|nr:hypothetical protein [Bacillota bacterium]